MKKLFSIILCLSSIFNLAACGKSEPKSNKIDMDIELVGSTASEDILLFDNPDRGFRLESYCSVGPTTDSSNNVHNLKQWNSKFEVAANRIKQGIWAKPKLVQTYVYLTDYKDEKTLPDHVFEKLQVIFDTVRAEGQKAVLRFTYQDDISKWENQASQEVMFAHMEQLKPILEKNKTAIYALEAGFLGPWGEWHGYVDNYYVHINATPDEYKGAKDTWDATTEFDEIEIIKHILDMTPEEIYVQLRYVMYRDMFLEAYPNQGYEKRLGLKNDGFFGYKDTTSQAWPYSKMTSKASKSAMEASMTTPMGGEFIWGCQWWNGYSRVTAQEAVLAFKNFHHSIFSVFHNSFEGTEDVAGIGDYAQWFATEREGDMSIWAQTDVTPKELDDLGVGYSPNWFVDRDGNEVNRTYFEYIRDHLGYRLEAKTLNIKGDLVPNGKLNLNMSLSNNGFAAPFNMTAEFVILNSKNEIVSSVSAGDVLKWYNKDEVETHTVNATIQLPKESGKYKLAFYFHNSAGDTAYLANQIDRMNGYNIFCNFEI